MRAEGQPWKSGPSGPRKGTQPPGLQPLCLFVVEDALFGIRAVGPKILS